MKANNIYISILSLCMLTLVSCVGDLDVSPTDPDIVSGDKAYNTVQDYKEGLSKLYATMAVNGQQGIDQYPDIEGINEGEGSYLRQYWNHQELTTDEAVWSWPADGLFDMHWHTWTANDKFTAALHSRIMYTVSLCNEYIRVTAGNTDADIQKFQAEARFLRALAYYHGIDLFGAMPFVTEENLPGAFFPERITRADLFTYVESELIDIMPKMGAAKFEYGRADQAAAAMLLAKLYLNAEVYIEEDKYAECLAALESVLSGPYSIPADYRHTFVADNDESPEMIFPITYDGIHTQTWGGMVFLIHSQIVGSMDPMGMFGTVDAWNGLRATSSFVNKFDLVNDSRALFWTDGQTLEIENITSITQGYGITKFRNRKLNGDLADSNHSSQVDTDWPIFRLADAYLMYAESVVRGGGGSRTQALDYVNQLRTRAYGDNSGNISDAEMTLDFLLDERAREMYYEGHRRTDLIRFGQFTNGTYQWPWKGNVKEGKATESFRNVFPVPTSQLVANPNLTPTDGY